MIQFVRMSMRVDLPEPFTPSITKISPSLTSTMMVFNNDLILEITSDDSRSTTRLMVRSFLHKSDNFQYFFILYERSVKTRIKRMKAKG